MRRLAAVFLTVLFSLIAHGASAQCVNFPADTVAGRLAIPSGGGGCQTIPFATLAAQLPIGSLPALQRTSDMRMVLVAGSWKVFKPDGSVLDTTGTCTQGLNEALQYIATNLTPLIVDGLRNAQGGGVITVTCPVVVPAMFGGYVEFRGASILCSGITNDDVVRVDSQEDSQIFFDYIANCDSNTGAPVRFKPTTALGDGITAIFASRFRFTEIYSGQQVTGRANIVFDLSGSGNISNNSFDGTAITGLSTKAITVTNGSGANSFWGNQIRFPLVRGTNGKQIQIGDAGSPAAGFAYGNTFYIESIDPPTADYAFDVRGTYNFFQVGLANTLSSSAFHFESTATDNKVFINGAFSSPVITDAGLRNSWCVDGVCYQAGERIPVQSANYTVGGVIYGVGAHSMNSTGIGTATTLLHGNAGGTGPTYSAVDLSADTTGVVPSTKGGAGSISGALTANGSGTVSQAACANLSNGAAGCSSAIAVQADQETATSVTTIVTPGRQQLHPSAAKAWAVWNGTTTGTNAPSAGFNVTSVQRSATGDYIVNFTQAFSSVNYACTASGTRSASAGTGAIATANTFGVSSVEIRTQNTVGTDVDITTVSVACFGDQ